MRARLPPRTRYVLAEYWTFIVVALVITGTALLGTAVLDATTRPGSTSGSQHAIGTTERTHVQQYSVAVNDSAVVTGNTTFWERGTRLYGSPVYFLHATPNLTLTLTTETPVNRSVTVTRKLSLVYKAVLDGKTFWQSERVLVNETSTVTDGAARTTTRLDITQVAARRATLKDDLPGEGTIRIRLVAHVSYASDRYSDTFTVGTPLTITQTTYELPTHPVAQRRHATTVEREHQTSPQPLAQLPARRGLGGAALLLLALVLFGTVRFRGLERPDPDDRHHARYEGWVSTGQLTLGVAQSTVDLDSLADLAELAIDMDNHVVYDPDRDTYGVIENDVLYRYEPARQESDPSSEETATVTDDARVASEHEFQFGASGTGPASTDSGDGTTDSIPSATDGGPTNNDSRSVD